MYAMTGLKLFHDQQVAAGEHVRIWEDGDGNLFEHVFPTGQSITIRCRTLDEARSLMAQSVYGAGRQKVSHINPGSTRQEEE
jgi:hypothetical protein